MTRHSLPEMERAPVLSLRLSPRYIGKLLTTLILSLSAISLALHLWRFLVNGGQQRWFIMLFDLGVEHSVPTYYQVIALLLAGLMLLAISRIPRRAGEPAQRAWLGLAIIFFALSMDELCQMHETIGYFVEKAVHPHGFFRFGWVVPGMAFAAVFGAVYLRFLFQLPLQTRLRFIVAGMIYVGGAVGLEMVGGKYADKHGEENLTYHLLSDAEETCEMLGIGLFIFVLTTHLAQKQCETRVTFSQSEWMTAKPSVSGSRTREAA